MFRLIQTREEAKNVFYRINQSNDPYTLPIRGMLEFVLAGKISTGKLFANVSLTAVAVVYEWSEYSKIDGDSAAIYVEDIDLFLPFFSWLCDQRFWIRKQRCLHLTFIRDDFVELAKSLLKGVDFYSDSTSMRLQYASQIGELPDLPRGFCLTSGTRNDASIVGSFWPSRLPDKARMLEWMLDKFPSNFVLDDKARPVAWLVTHSCGAYGPMFVLPEFRRARLAGALSEETFLQHQSLYQYPPYGGVHLTNTPAVALSVANKNITTNAFVSSVVFGYTDSKSKF